MSSRAELDAIAWDIIDKTAGRPTPPPGLAASGRPCNYEGLAELSARWDHELAWSEFLHEFFRYKQASFFDVPPPRSVSLQRRALLAGVAEYLCTRYSLPIPEWVNAPEFFLHDFWDLWEDLCPDMEEFSLGRIERSPEAFLKRRVVFEARNLITL